MSSTERPPFPDGARIHRLSTHLRQRFGRRVYKVTLRGGFSCPNRDGRIGLGGCIFCSEQALLPLEGPVHGDLAAQLAAGLAHLERRYGPSGAIAYFQEGASTDAPVPELARLYGQVLADDRVLALSIGTRPDCLPDPVLELLGRLAGQKPIWLELGLQSASDETLRRLRRRHTAADFAQAVHRARAKGLEVIAHVILDLPGEGPAERAATAALLNQLGVAGAKVHNLHVLAHTPLAAEFQGGQVTLSTLEEYLDQAVEFLERLDERVVVHRLTGEAPRALMLAPRWGLNKRRVLGSIERRLGERETWQGRLAGMGQAPRGR